VIALPVAGLPPLFLGAVLLSLLVKLFLGRLEGALLLSGASQPARAYGRLQ